MGKVCLLWCFPVPITPYLKKYCSIAIAVVLLTIYVPSVSAKLFDGPVDRLPTLERAALRDGKVTLAGREGNYTARVLIKAPAAKVWEVLTDYNNFEQFLPNVASSELIQANGNQKVFEQINSVQVLVINKKTRIRIAVTESYPQQINFQIVNGDLKSLNGKWTIQPVSPYPSAPADQVLITHQVSVQPLAGGSIFYGIYEDTLQKTLAAIKQETELRFLQAKS
ncbi:hypothetical protein STA3757_37950 [Stanieria sp. NIES-3757]|nr:hypothetical protein STA3757_37950 [Stanieria sp. NIES-3757]